MNTIHPFTLIYKLKTLKSEKEKKKREKFKNKFFPFIFFQTRALLPMYIHLNTSVLISYIHAYARTHKRIHIRIMYSTHIYLKICIHSARFFSISIHTMSAIITVSCVGLTQLHKQHEHIHHKVTVSHKHFVYSMDFELYYYFISSLIQSSIQLSIHPKCQTHTHAYKQQRYKSDLLLLLLFAKESIVHISCQLRFSFQYFFV